MLIRPGSYGTGVGASCLGRETQAGGPVEGGGPAGKGRLGNVLGCKAVQ